MPKKMRRPVRPRAMAQHLWEQRPPSDGGWIYAAQEEGTPLVKIGCTCYSPLERLYALHLEFRVPLTLLAAVVVHTTPYTIESCVHRLLAAEHITQEWFYGYMTQQRLERLTAQAIQMLKEGRAPVQKAHWKRGRVENAA
jgi:hypothetical protein